MEVGFDMNTNIVETLPWIDYREVFQKIEERGEERGKVTRDIEIAMNAFRRAGSSSTGAIETLRDLGISDDTIRNAHKQVETERAGEIHESKRSESEQ
jgi:hypothetical protein